MITSSRRTFFSYVILPIAIACLRCSGPDTIAEQSDIRGTWQLISEVKIEGKDSTFTPAAKNQRMIKILNATHFAFLRHDLTNGKDSAAVFVAGGGSYELRGRNYRENLEYCNLREWENHTFDFTVEIVNDTLIQRGQEKIENLGIDRIIVEKYVKVGNPSIRR